MKTLIGLFLAIVGAAIIIVGAGMALRELVGLYGGVMNDPLGQPDGEEKRVSDAMIHGVLIGGIGILPFLIGTVMLKTALFRRARSRFR